MDYEKKYKESLERARELLEGMDKGEYFASNGDIENIFPELKEKESEDERIRKCIVAVVCAAIWNSEFSTSKDECLIWLEKQGEQTQLDYEYADIPQKDFAPIEPKFHPGDWITDGHLTCKLLSVTGKSYELHLYNDDYCHFETDVQSVDKHYRLWTIQDAKVGDVLVHNSCPFIFMGIEDGIVQALEENLYEGTNPVNFGEPKIDKDYQPATKEQHNLLFQQMKEAGYEWDAEKKELKKIKSKKLDVWNAEDEQNLNVVLSFIEDESLRRWLKDKLCYDTLDADKVIAWLVSNILDYEYLVKLFKKDFGLC